MGVQIRTLREEDVPAALRLSEQAGWNQIEADWERLLDLAPDGCFAGVVDGEIVATSTLVTFEETAGWIGMVLVDEDHRRRGFGSQIFQRALDAAVERELSEIGLDATDAGRAVYRQEGFVDVAPIERWRGAIDAPRGDADAYPVVRDPPLETVRTLDRRACGLDRSDLLDHFAREESIETLLVADPETDDAAGYAVVRPGQECPQIGPVVAADADAFGSLLGAVEDLTGDSPVIIDVLAGPELKNVLGEAGLERRRRLTRMTYRESVRTLLGEDVAAAAGFELG